MIYCKKKLTFQDCSPLVSSFHLCTSGLLRETYFLLVLETHLLVSSLLAEDSLQENNY